MKFTKFSEIKRNTSSRYLVHHLIPAQGITVVWGKPKSGKTFWTLNIAMHVAGGIEYRGRSIEATGVFYCAFEGAFAFPDRILAIANHLELTNKDIPFYFSPDRIMFGKVSGPNDIIVAIKRTGSTVGMVILDTLARSFEGDENSSEDMKFYIKCAEDIVRDLNCAVVIIHHCGVDGSRPRGHTALTGACDAQIKIERASNIGSPIIQIKAQVEFMKDGPEDTEEYSVLQPHVIDGIEVCFVEDAPSGTNVLFGKDKLGGYAAKALTILQKTLQQTGDSKITLQEWREIFVETCPGGKVALNKAFGRARDKLLDNGTVRVVDQTYVEVTGKET